MLMAKRAAWKKMLTAGEGARPGGCLGLACNRSVHRQFLTHPRSLSLECGAVRD